MSDPGQRHVVICGIDDSMIDGLRVQLEGLGPWSVVSIAWPLLQGFDEVVPLAYVLLGVYEPASRDWAARLAARPKDVPLVWVGGTPDKSARPDAWLPAPASMTMLAAILAALVKAREQPRSPRQRKSDLILGSSTAIQTLLHTIDRFASSSAAALITGESGTGKELVARALHSCGERADGPFVAINCAAIPDTLFEAELFGHNRGAFTGAVAVRPGVFESADHGTLFLDEIGEIPPALQVKLLRVLETHEVSRLGSNEARRVDVRVVAATNRDLEEAVRARTFREDFYYRLNVCPIRVPPLRERAEDIPVLVSHYLDVLAQREKQSRPTLAHSALEKLLSYAWPGNVRELIAVLQRALLLAQGGLIDDRAIDLPAGEKSLIAPYRDAKALFERTYYETLLRTAGGQITLAAKLADKTRKEIYDALARLGLKRDPS
ncbi:MAG TPA: sigma-54 dependent transcriptional regulator [Kofleriaceae bacterium]|nr:sigma-54 dependent transcriptional regulator [Kofleriaceae bacterium]